MNKITKLLLASSSFTAMVLGAQSAYAVCPPSELCVSTGGTITYTPGSSNPTLDDTSNGNGVQLGSAGGSVNLDSVFINKTGFGPDTEALRVISDTAANFTFSGGSSTLIEAGEGSAAFNSLFAASFDSSGSSGGNLFEGTQGLVFDAHGGALSITTKNGDIIQANANGPATTLLGEGNDFKPPLLLGNASFGTGGYTAGIYAGNTSAATIDFDGNIQGDGTHFFDAGIAVLSTGASTVNVDGSIKAGIVGIFGDAGNGALSVNNNGFITGAVGGIVQNGEGLLTVHNYSTGIITATATGLSGEGSIAIENIGAGSGGLVVTNDHGGVIVGVDKGIDSNAVGDSVTNLGQISSGTFSAGTITVSAGEGVGIYMEHGTINNGQSAGGVSALIQGGGAGIGIGGNSKLPSDSSGLPGTVINNYAGATIKGGQASIFVGNTGYAFINNFGDLIGDVTVGRSGENGAAASISLFAGSSVTGNIDLSQATGRPSSVALVSGSAAAPVITGTLIGNSQSGANADALILRGEGSGAFNLNNQSGFANVNKNGTGTWELTTAYSGSPTLVLLGGTLKADVAGAFGTGGIRFVNATSAGTLSFANGTYTNTIGLMMGSGSASNVATFSTDALATLSGAITQFVSGCPGGTCNSAMNVVFTGSVGNGTFTLSNTNNSWAGTTSILKHTNLQFDAAHELGTGTIFIGDATQNAALTLTAAEGTVTLANAVTIGAGNGIIGVTNSSAQLKLTGTVTTNGGLLYKDGAGKLDFGSASTLTAGTNLEIDGGAVVFDTLNAGQADLGQVDGIGTLTVNGIAGIGYGISGSSSLTNLVTGTGTLVKRGSGALTILNTSNSFSHLEIDAGTLVAGNNNVLGNGTLAFGENGGTLDLDGHFQSVVSLSAAGEGNSIITNNGGSSAQLTLTNPASTTFNGVIQDGAHNIEVEIRAGRQTFTGVNTYSGETDIDSGAQLDLAGAGSIANSSAVLVESTGIFDISNTNSGTSITALRGESGSQVRLGTKTLTVTRGEGTFSGVISGSGGLTVDTGGAYLQLEGTNTYTGATHIISGTLEVSGENGTLAANNMITVESGAGLEFSGVANQGVLGSISGAGDVSLGAFENASLDIITSDVQTLAYSATGTLRVGESSSFLANSFSSASGTVMIDSTSAVTAYDLTGGADFQIAAGGVLVVGAEGGSDTFGGTISGGGHFWKNQGSTLTLTGNNSGFTGEFEINAGTVILGAANALPGALATSVTGTLDVNGYAATLVSLTGEGTITNNGGAAATVALNGGEFGGTIKDGAKALAVTITGDTELSGSLTYTGATTITSGKTLTLDSNLTGSTIADNGTLETATNITIKSLSGEGAVATDGHTLTIAAADPNTVFGGDIGGSGNLHIAGGTLILTGESSYTGTTLVDSGATLQLGNGSGEGNIANGAGITINGTIAIDHTGTTALNSSLAGTGSVKLMAGTLNIAAAQNTLAGTLTINNGTEVDLTGSGAVTHMNVADNGTFDISGISSSTTSIQGLSGTGTVNLGAKQLVLNGTGTFSGSVHDGGAGGSVQINGNETLSGTNSWTGATTVLPNATLIVAGPSSLGSGALTFYQGSTIKFLSGGSFTQNATFQTAAPIYDVTGTTVTWSGQMTGPGDLAVTGAGGTLILTNATNTYAGGTEVYGGATLQIDQDAELGAVKPLQLGDATTNGTLKLGAAFNLASGRAISLLAGGGTINTNGFNSTISQAITGAGGLTKTGTGTLTLSGTSTFNGASKVNGGTLLVTGAIGSSAVAVNSGGTLAGTGTVGAVTVASGGTLAPGNGGVGTLTVNGGLTLASGATTQVDVTTTGADKIVASGAASLGGSTLALNVGAGTYTKGTDFTLLTASSLTGTFSPTPALAGLFGGQGAALNYSSTAVDLVVGATSNTFAFGTYGRTPNQIAAGNAVAAGSPTSALYTGLGSLVGSNTAAVPETLAQLSGEIHASLRTAALQDSRVIRDTVLDRSESLDPGLWITGFVASGHVDGDGNANTVSHNNAGVIGGYDVSLGNGLTAGIGGAYTEQKIGVPTRLSTATGNASHVIAYASYGSGNFGFSLGGDYSWGSNHVARVIAASGETDVDHQSNTGSQVFADAGYTMATRIASLTPFVDIARVTATTGAFTETGGLGTLSGASKSSSQTYSTLGLRLARATPTAGGMTVTPHFSVGWQHGFDTVVPGQVVTLTGIGQSFTVLGAPVGTDTAALEAGMDFTFSPSATLSLGYDGSVSRSEQIHAGKLSFAWTF